MFSLITHSKFMFVKTLAYRFRSFFVENVHIKAYWQNQSSLSNQLAKSDFLCQFKRTHYSASPWQPSHFRIQNFSTGHHTLLLMPCSTLHRNMYKTERQETLFGVYDPLIEEGFVDTNMSNCSFVRRLRELYSWAIVS